MNHFEEFPKQIQSATNLMKLDLSENYITEVPAFIGRFKNLRELKLHRLRLKSLPEEIGELENLKLLDASMNQLSSIPESISKLTQLNGLLLTWNDFEEIPKHLPSSLEIIYIGGNKRKFTDESIGTIRVKPDAVEPNNIIDRVWLGSMIAGKNKHYLKSIGITHVLSVLNDCRPFYPDDFTYLSINLEDDDSEDIKQHFTKAIDFMDTAIYDSDGHVFVHCAAGVSRSATIVIAYLMKKQNLSFDDALKIVQTKRPVICPNVGFREQLKTYEEELKEQQTSVCVLS
jgi:protein-tyrosine phosphatase